MPNSRSSGGNSKVIRLLGMNIILNVMTRRPSSITGAYSLMPRFISFPTYLMSMEIRIARRRRANSMMRPDAISKKWELGMETLTMPMTRTNRKSAESRSQAKRRSLKSSVLKYRTFLCSSLTKRLLSTVAITRYSSTITEKPTTMTPRHSLFTCVKLSLPYLSLQSPTALLR